MSQVTYEIIRKLFEIYPIILQIVLFLVLWNVFFRWEKGIWIVAGILAPRTLYILYYSVRQRDT